MENQAKETCDEVGTIEYVGASSVLENNPKPQPIIRYIPNPIERKLKEGEE